MDKDFDGWNKFKKELNAKSNFPYANNREIWWCALGNNVGVEIDGKHENRERPAVILKAFNTEMLFVIPLTTKIKNGKHYYSLQRGNVKSCAVLSQARLISAKRLIRKIGKVAPEDFRGIKIKFQELLGLKIESPAFAGLSRSSPKEPS